jgi:hypothetical protein
MLSFLHVYVISFFWAFVLQTSKIVTSGTSNNGHCRGIPILSFIGGVRLFGVRKVTNFTIVLVTIRSD